MARRPEHLAPPEVVIIFFLFIIFNKHLISIFFLLLFKQFYNESEARKYTSK